MLSIVFLFVFADVLQVFDLFSMLLGFVSFYQQKPWSGPPLVRSNDKNPGPVTPQEPVYNP